MKGIYAFALLPLLAAASPLMVDTIHNEAAPVLSSVQSKVVPDSYIVVFKQQVRRHPDVSSVALISDPPARDMTNACVTR